MAKCVSCNTVVSEFYLKDGVCPDCIERDIKKEQDELKRISLLPNIQQEEFNSLKNKYLKNINIDKFFQLKKYIDEIKIKHHAEISIDNYLFMETQLIPYIDILVKKRDELVIFNDYSPKKYDLWNNEIDKFIENTFSSLLKANNIPIHISFLKDFIFKEIEKNYSRYRLKNVNTIVEEKIRINPTFLFFSFVLILMILYIFSGKESYDINYGSSSSNSSNTYQDRYNSEKAQTLRDIQKAVDEAKYQEWKHKQ